VTNLAPLLSSRDMCWETPPDLFARFDAEFGFTLDAAALPATAKCARYFTPDDDALVQDWGREVVWLNPPYGRAIAGFMAKAADAARNGATVVCLVPARTDTAWWHDSVIGAGAEVRFLRGRVAFRQNGATLYPAPFPSALVIYRPVAA
jgi:phage N-6-adenine-methyltransferase